MLRGQPCPLMNNNTHDRCTRIRSFALCVYRWLKKELLRALATAAASSHPHQPSPAAAAAVTLLHSESTCAVQLQYSCIPAACQDPCICFILQWCSMRHAWRRQATNSSMLTAADPTAQQQERHGGRGAAQAELNSKCILILEIFTSCCLLCNSGAMAGGGAAQAAARHAG